MSFGERFCLLLVYPLDFTFLKSNFCLVIFLEDLTELSRLNLQASSSRPGSKYCHSLDHSPLASCCTRQHLNQDGAEWMRRQTVERLKAAGSAKSYVRVTASGGHVSLVSVGVEVCFQGTWTWLMTAVRGRGSWRLMKGRRKCAEKGCEANSVKGHCLQRNKREVCFFFHSLWGETSCLSLTSAPLDSPVLRGFWTPGHKATGQLSLSGLYFKESDQNKKQKKQKTMMSLL